MEEKRKRNKRNTVWIEPVRDWNRAGLILNSKLKKCELNLWGIETVCKVWIYWGNYHVWIEPVRDWNKNFLNLRLSSWTCVNWTCEGLKHVSNTIFCHPYSVWIEPVRDWNSDKPHGTIPSSVGVNWTCEGLKRCYIKWVKNGVILCELNLWGIETWFIFGS